MQRYYNFREASPKKKNFLKKRCVHFCVHYLRLFFGDLLFISPPGGEPYA